MVPSINLTKDEKKEYQRIMIQGANALNQLAEIAKMDCKAFRARFFKKEFNPQDWAELNPQQVAIFYQNIPAIKSLRSIEWRVVCGYANLISNLANRHFRRVENKSVVNIKDFEQEATLGLLEAIHTYSKENIKFITYAWNVIRNRLNLVLNQSNPFGPITNKAIKLITRYSQTKLNLNRPASHEEICEIMELNDVQRKTLDAAMVKVHHQKFVRSENTDEYEGDDYTCFRKDVKPQKFRYMISLELRDLIDRANLTKLQREIIETSLTHKKQWRKEFASKTLNSHQKPCSRQHIENQLKIAYAKLEEVCIKGGISSYDKE